MAGIILLLFVILLGLTFSNHRIISFMQKHFCQPIREHGPKSHHKKTGTPTCGGLIILTFFLILYCIFSIIASQSWESFLSPEICLILFITLTYGVIGYIDDYRKISSKTSRGLSGKMRLFLEYVLAFSALSVYYMHENILTHSLYFHIIPFTLNEIPYLYYAAFGAFVITSCANSYNLTDGLDGLATSIGIVILITIGVLYSIAPKNIGSEVLIIISSMILSLITFLRINWHPAKIFMGDIGSLSIGAFIGILTVIMKIEFLLLLFAIVLIIESLSVIIQVISRKLRNKKVFRMAPIHHHFEYLGYSEKQIVAIFITCTILMSVISILIYRL